jgi:hypothetical protein
MSKAPQGSNQEQVNNSSPAMSVAKVGDCIGDLINLENTGMITKAGLAIKSGGASPLAAAASGFVAQVNGAIVYVAAATSMPAIAGTLPTADSAAWAFYVNQSGTLSASAMATPASTVAGAIANLVSLAAATAPAPVGAQQPVYSALIGFIVVSNATGGNFTAGTTNLDAASVTTLYFDALGNSQLVPLLTQENRPIY